MAATDFVGEIRSVGERLLLKLQQLPQAEPVELAAFSILVLFTGKWGIWPDPLALCPQCPTGLPQYLGDQPVVPAGRLASLHRRSRKSSVPEEARGFATSPGIA